MLIPSIQRGQSGLVIDIVRNVDSVTHVEGDLVLWSNGGTPIQRGVDVITAASADEDLIAGVILGRDVAIGDYGWCQCYGYHDNVKSTGTINVGDPVKAGGSRQVAAGVAGDGPGSFVGICLKAASGGRAGVFLRMM